MSEQQRWKMEAHHEYDIHVRTFQKNNQWGYELRVCRKGIDRHAPGVVPVTSNPDVGYASSEIAEMLGFAKGTALIAVLRS